jgi:hypothetical protein
MVSSLYLCHMYLSILSYFLIIVEDQGSLKSMLDMNKTLLDQLEMEEIGSMQIRLKDFLCHSTR